MLTYPSPYRLLIHGIETIALPCQEHITTELQPQLHTPYLFHNPPFHLQTWLEKAGCCTLLREPLSTLVPRNYKDSRSWKRKTDTVTGPVVWQVVGIFALGKDLCGHKQLTWDTQTGVKGAGEGRRVVEPLFELSKEKMGLASWVSSSPRVGIPGVILENHCRESVI